MLKTSIVATENGADLYLILSDDYDYGCIQERVLVNHLHEQVARNKAFFRRTCFLHLRNEWNNHHREHKVRLIQDGNNYGFEYV